MKGSCPEKEGNMSKKWFCAMTVAAMIGSSCAAFGAETEPEVPQDIVILVTSDIHCGVSKNFGVVGLEQIRETMDANGDYTLLVDDGDAIQGELLGTMTSGEAIISLMNDLQYDVAIPGNHEFDFGMDQFMSLVEKAEFPYISCNFTKEGELVFDPYVIIEVGGKKIGFVGVTTPQTLSTSTPAYFMDENDNFIYGFCEDKTGEKLYETVQKAVDDVRAEGVDYVFLMAHLGNSEASSPWTYADVVSHISGVDGVLDGHSHDYDQVTMNDKDGNEVFRMGVGTKMGGIGCVRISGEDGSISHELYTWNNDKSMPELTGIDNKMVQCLNDATADLDATMKQVVGKTEVDLKIYDPEAKDESGEPIRLIRRTETNLGDLCADALRIRTGADVSIMNGGGIRADLLKGDITYYDLMTIHPYGNMISVAKVTGQQILDALEWGVHAFPDESGGFLQVSGMTYEFDPDIESSCTMDEHGMFTGVEGDYRVKNVMVGDEPLDLEKEYSLATIDYLLSDYGDGFTMFKDCEIIESRVQLDVQLLIDYVGENLGGVIAEGYEDPYGEGRIVAVEGASDEAMTETEPAA